MSCVGGRAAPNRKSPQAAGLKLVLVGMAAVAVKIEWIADNNSENRLRRGGDAPYGIGSIQLVWRRRVEGERWARAALAGDSFA
ncbi:hypothetical protein CK910_22155 [Aeromonas sp. CA23]|nr:hypothetical protein CK910_22155 [Aeromonas sp. CA23]